MRKISIVIISLVSGLFLVATPVKANEGVVQMEASDGTQGRCFVVSTLLADFRYKMLVNCRGLKYPIAQNLFQYVMWADHGDDKPTRLGTLGIGKREFAAPRAYGRLYVTKEAGSEPQQPSNNMFMSGGVSPIAYLEGVGVDVVAPNPSPTPTPATQDPSVPQIPDPADEDASSVGIGSVIRVLGVIVIVIVVIIVIIAFVSASRRRPIDI